MSDLKDALAVLELPQRTTRPEVRKAYRKLIKVWHPDRFTGDPELQAEAEERTKRITVAYRTVMDYLKARQDAAHAGPSAEEARRRETEELRRRETERIARRRAAKEAELRAWEKARRRESGLYGFKGVLILWIYAVVGVFSMSAIGMIVLWILSMFGWGTNPWIEWWRTM